MLDDSEDISLPSSGTAGDFTYDIAESVKKCIKKEIRLSRNSIKKRIKTAKFILEVFSEDLKNDMFSEWLSNLLGFRSDIDFRDFLEYADKEISQRGRKSHKLDAQIALKVYQFWKNNSIISIDCRNDRNVVRISKAKVNSLCRDIEDSNVSPVQTKFGEKLQAHRYIYMKSICKMYTSFIKSNNKYVSMSTFY